MVRKYGSAMIGYHTFMRKRYENESQFVGKKGNSLRNKRFRVFRAAGMLLLVLVLSSCGGGTANNNVRSPSPGTTGATANTVKLRIYAQYFDNDTKKPYDYAVAELKKAMPNVELVLEPS